MLHTQPFRIISREFLSRCNRLTKTKSFLDLKLLHVAPFDEILLSLHRFSTIFSCKGNFWILFVSDIATKMTNLASDASQMLAAALEQMDDIIAGKIVVV